MGEPRYIYRGSLEACEIKELILKSVQPDLGKMGLLSLKLKTGLDRLLMEDERWEVQLKPDRKQLLKAAAISCMGRPVLLGAWGAGIGGLLGHVWSALPPVILPYMNVYINVRAATVTLFVLLLDVRLTQGFATMALGLAGFNSRALVKLKETEGGELRFAGILQQQGTERKPGAF